MKSISLTIAFVFFLSACAPVRSTSPTAIPTPISPPTATPTEVPATPTVAPTATAPIPTIDVGGLQVPDPKATNPEFFDLQNHDSPIVQFARAFGVQPEEIADLTPVLKTGADGRQFVILTTPGVAPADEFDAKGRALIVGAQGSDGSWSWHAPMDVMNGVLFGDQIKIGTVIGHYGSSDVVNNYFSAGTMSYSWNRVERTRGSADANNVASGLISDNLGNHMKTFRISHIVSSNGEPPWLQSLTTDAECEQVLKDWIRFVIETYSPRGVTQFNVVNEPLLSENDYFVKALGTDRYVLLAFEEANQVRRELMDKAKANNQPVPVIELGFSNAENHYSTGYGYASTLAITKMLAETGLVDYVDVHFHVKRGRFVSAENVERTLKQYGQIVNKTTGKPVKVVIGEMDINISSIPVSDPERFIKQGSLGNGYFRAILDSGVREITFWGVRDVETWNPNGDLSPDALLFEDNGSPKPLVYALENAILETLVK